MQEATGLGAEFARALAAKDSERVRDLMHPEIDFRGMTPRRSLGGRRRRCGRQHNARPVVRGFRRDRGARTTRLRLLCRLRAGRLPVQGPKPRRCVPGRAAGVSVQPRWADRVDPGAVLGVPAGFIIGLAGLASRIRRCRVCQPRADKLDTRWPSAVPSFSCTGSQVMPRSGPRLRPSFRRASDRSARMPVVTAAANAGPTTSRPLRIAARGQPCRPAASSASARVRYSFTRQILPSLKLIRRATDCSSRAPDSLPFMPRPPYLSITAT